MIFIDDSLSRMRKKMQSNITNKRLALLMEHSFNLLNKIEEVTGGWPPVMGPELHMLAGLLGGCYYGLSDDTFYLTDFLNHKDADVLFHHCFHMGYDADFKSRSVKNLGNVYEYDGRPKIKPNDELNNTVEKEAHKLIYRGLQKEGIWLPLNNIVVNRYADNAQSMGYHSDDMEQSPTGVFILSLGYPRNMSLKSNKTGECFQFELRHNSLFYLSAQANKEYKHAVLPDDEEKGVRISLSFRYIE